MSITRRKFIETSTKGIVGAAALSCLPASLASANLQRRSAYAASTSEDAYADVMLAVFTNSENDSTDTFYMSVDGIHFEKISEAFVNLYPNDPNNTEAVGSGSEENPVHVADDTDPRTWSLHSFKCPSLIYHNGYFWMLANESNSGDDGTLRLVVSNSKDLVNWCDQRQVKVTVPSGITENGTSGQFDAVGADWAVGDDGNVYAVVSMGLYGAFHGDPENDTMAPYLVKITELSATNDPATNAILNDAAYITVTCEQAIPINLPLSDSNRIDGSLYFENGLAYLSIKRNGVTNEIWSIGDLSKASTKSAWTSVNSNVITGYEAPCLTKFNGTYYMYTDELATWTPDDHVRAPYYRTGTNVQQSQSLASGWSTAQNIDPYDKDYTSLSVYELNNEYGDGPRHGTVTTVTDDEAKKIIWERRYSYGWTSDQDPYNRFPDVYSWDWYFESVLWASEQGLIKGYDEGEMAGYFGVGDPLTRAQFATILWRYSCPAEYAAYDKATQEATVGSTELPDGSTITGVTSGEYYTAAANWALSEGIITGWDNEDGTHDFDANGNMDFEQMVTMFSRRFGGEEAKAFNTSSLLSNTSLTDANEVEEYAQTYMAWALSNDVISGYDNGDGTYTLGPLEEVARERAATLVYKAYQAGKM